MSDRNARTHYEVLGVARDATAVEIRRAYVSLARANHPDLAAGEAAEGSESERRMQRINEAWKVLGDDAERRSYDRTLGQAERARVHQAREAGLASPDFVPLDDSDDPEDPAAEHDIPYGDGTPLPPVVQLAPALLLVGGFMAAGAGGLFESTALLGIGAVGIVFGLLAFAAIPLYVALRSHDHAPD